MTKITISAAGTDYGLGLCHTCVKLILELENEPPENPAARRVANYAITLAPALVPVPVPGNEDIAYNAAITLPACLDHLATRPVPDKEPLEVRRRRLLTP